MTTTIPRVALGQIVIYVDMVSREFAAIISRVENAERGMVSLHVMVPGGTGVRVVQGVVYSARKMQDTWHLPPYLSQQGGQG